MNVCVCVCVCVCAHTRSVSQQCLSLFNPIDCSPPGSSVHGIFQARIMEQFAISYSRGSSRPRDQTQVSCLLHWQVNSLPLSHLGSPRSMNTSGKSFLRPPLHLFPLISIWIAIIYVEKAMTPHSSTLAWKIPWMEGSGGLQSMGSRGVGHDWAASLLFFTLTFHFHALEKEMATHSSVLAWRIPGMEEPGRLPSMGSHWVGHD